MDWNSSALWGIIGLVGGFIISFIFFQLAKPRKKIIFKIKTNQLVSENIRDIRGLHMDFKEKNIRSLYISKVKMKNTGNTIILKNDFPTSDLLLFKALDVRTTKIHVKKNINHFNFDFKPQCNDSSYYTIDFEYIPEKLKLYFWVIHENPEFIIQGTLKDGEIISTRNYSLLNIISSHYISTLIRKAYTYLNRGRGRR